jgi:hypothetical protein
MPYCKKTKGKCPFEFDSEPCRERTACGCACNVIATKEVDDGSNSVEPAQSDAAPKEP